MRDTKDVVASVIATVVISGITCYFAVYDRLVQVEKEVAVAKIWNLEQRLATIERKLSEVERSREVRLYPGAGGSSILAEGIVMLETFDGKVASWIKLSDTFRNRFANGQYVLSQENHRGFAYSTITMQKRSFQHEDYEIVLTALWHDGDTGGSFGILMYAGQEQLMRFHVSKAGKAAVSMKLGSGEMDDVIQGFVSLPASDNILKQKVKRRGDSFFYSINNKEIGSFPAIGWRFSNLGVFIEGNQTVGFDELLVMASNNGE